ncbi:Subtilisin-like protease SBT5.6, partial [Cucurbita argyrosperma subsp. argyrosperma]
MEISSLFCLLLLVLLLPPSSCLAQKQAYIVYFGEHSGDKSWEEIEERHHSYLMSVKDTENDAKSSLLYSYKHTINGFAAVLTQQQASKLSELEEVVSVIESKKYGMHTTRSWEFSGVQEDKPRLSDLVSKAKSGKDVVIGMLDSGEHSFGPLRRVPNLRRNKMYPLVYAVDIQKPHVPRNESGSCIAGSLSHKKAKGKIVLCYRGQGISRYAGSLEVKRSGGAGMILGLVPAVGARLHADPHFVPATAVSYDDANRILKYIKSHRNPTATIVPPITIYGSRPAPAMANFTSRGPSLVDPHFLKPDITAPGVDILAAWSEKDSPTKLPKSFDPRIVKYNIYSGTSMSCPHVSAAAALLRAIHPTWSQAAIRSALMTTATTTNKYGHPITDDSTTDNSPATPFSFGSGHFRPTKAADPGLVYDANYTDYLHYLCGLKMNSIDRLLQSWAPPGVAVRASPSVLYFDRVGQRKRFTITVSGKVKGNGYSFGWFAWSDGVHYVRSPIAISST